MRQWMLLMALLLLGAAPAPTELLSTAGKSTVGQPLPWFSGWTPQQRVINRKQLLADTAAKGHALVFFATWCLPCEAGLAELAAKRNQLDAAGLRIILVNHREGAEKVVPWLRARGLGELPLLLDKFGTASRDVAGLGAQGQQATLPRTVVVDRQGVVRRIIGREGPDYIHKIIEAVKPG